MTASNVVLLRPEMLALGLLILPLLFLAVRRLRGLARWRRRLALGLQTLSALLLLVAVAEPALVKEDNSFSLVVVLDSSASLSDEARQGAADYASGVLMSAQPTSEVRFVATARQATLLTTEQVQSGSWLTDRVPGPESGVQSQTDLAAGLRLAGSLLGDGGRRRVVLVSDGWETQGQAASEADRLAARGIDVKVVSLGALGDPEVILEEVAIAPYVRVGDGLQTDLRIYSTGATTASVRVTVDGRAFAERQVALTAGVNVVSFEERADVPGFHRIEAVIEAADDTSDENNSAAATLVVKPQPRVLVLEERSGEAADLVRALLARQITVDVRPPSTVPAQLGELDPYDTVILNNVAATSLTLDQQRTLREFVRRNGRGLVTVGGNTSYAKGGYSESVFEEVLPVSSQPAPRPEKGETAIILVMDRSSSMDEYRGSSQDPSKFSMAKEAGRLAIDSLRAGDTVGVLTFDTEYAWTLLPQEITGDADKENIKGLISNIELGGGTYIYPAVREASEKIRQVEAPAKHIVLLTDGKDYHSDDYPTLMEQLRSEGVTLSAIAIGRDSDRELLTRLAKMGQGRYYFTERIDQIPKIVFKELDLALKEASIEGAIQPQILAPSPVLRGFAQQDLPQLGGYDITTAKPESVVGLIGDQGFPILAHWNYGLGRVAAFTSDASQKWAKNWLTWGDFSRFWSQTVRWTMASPVNPRLQPYVTVEERAEGPVALLTVESLNADNSFADLANVSAALRGPTGVVTTTVLSQTAPGRYEAEVPVSERGAYEVRVNRESDQPASEAAGFAVPTGAEWLHAGTNSSLLRRLSGGKEFYTDPAQALDPSELEGRATGYDPLWIYFLAPALVLLLLSVAVRRIDLRFRSRVA